MTLFLVYFQTQNYFSLNFLVAGHVKPQIKALSEAHCHSVQSNL